MLRKISFILFCALLFFGLVATFASVDQTPLQINIKREELIDTKSLNLKVEKLSIQVTQRSVRFVFGPLKLLNGKPATNLPCKIFIETPSRQVISISGISNSEGYCIYDSTLSADAQKLTVEGNLQLILEVGMGQGYGEVYYAGQIFRSNTITYQVDPIRNLSVDVYAQTTDYYAQDQAKFQINITNKAQKLKNVKLTLHLSGDVALACDSIKEGSITDPKYVQLIPSIPVLAQPVATVDCPSENVVVFPIEELDSNQVFKFTYSVYFPKDGKFLLELQSEADGVGRETMYSKYFLVQSKNGDFFTRLPQFFIWIPFILPIILLILLWIFIVPGEDEVLYKRMIKKLNSKNLLDQTEEKTRKTSKDIPVKFK